MPSPSVWETGSQCSTGQSPSIGLSRAGLKATATKLAGTLSCLTHKPRGDCFGGYRQGTLVAQTAMQSPGKLDSRFEVSNCR